MTWLEWVGAGSIAIFMPLGIAVMFIIFIQWCENKKYLWKVPLDFYIAKLRRENRERRGP